jgi:3-hydroxy-D-aspartate aldolase
MSTLPPPARIGDAIADVDTPALLLDLDAFEHNLDTMVRVTAGSGMRLRPHAKSHKCPQIALAQMQRGAVGVCSQKVSEAETLVDGGVRNVLVSNEVVGASKLACLARLAKRAEVSVLADHPDAVTALSKAAQAEGSTIAVLVEVDVGAGRCGVAPGEPAAALARHIAAQPGLTFGGIHAYQGGAQHLRTPAEREAAIAKAVAMVNDSIAAMAKSGLAVPIVTGAGTGTFLLEAGSGVYGELQPGSYVFMDADYARNGDPAGDSVGLFRQSLHILSTVMSRPSASRAVVDVGLKAHSVDSGMPRIDEPAGAEYLRASDEHGLVSVPAGVDIPLGSKLKLVPGHCDPTVNLYDWLVCHRHGRVEAIWPIAGRGAFY